MVKNLPANAGDVRDVGSIPGSGRSPQGGHGNPFLHSCLENPLDRGAWWATFHGFVESTLLSGNRSTMLFPTESLQYTVTRTKSGGARGKEPACQCRRCKRRGFDPWVGKIPWRRRWQPTPVFLPGEYHGQKHLVGYSP